MKSAMNAYATKIFSVAAVLCGCWFAIAQQGQTQVAAVTVAVAPAYPPAALALLKGDDAVI
jgi:hypothetical protein